MLVIFMKIYVSWEQEKGMNFFFFKLHRRRSQRLRFT